MYDCVPAKESKVRRFLRSSVHVEFEDEDGETVDLLCQQQGRQSFLDSRIHAQLCSRI